MLYEKLTLYCNFSHFVAYFLTNQIPTYLGASFNAISGMPPDADLVRRVTAANTQQASLSISKTEGITQWFLLYGFVCVFIHLHNIPSGEYHPYPYFTEKKLRHRNLAVWVRDQPYSRGWWSWNSKPGSLDKARRPLCVTWLNGNSLCGYNQPIHLNLTLELGGVVCVSVRACVRVCVCV